jgi:hypothetical protein
MIYKRQNRVCNEVCNDFLGQIGDWVWDSNYLSVTLSNPYRVKQSTFPGVSSLGLVFF